MEGGFRLLVDRLTEELSPLGRHLFDLLVLRELSLEEVVREAGMSPDAVGRLLDEMSKRPR